MGICAFVNVYTIHVYYIHINMQVLSLYNRNGNYLKIVSQSTGWFQQQNIFYWACTYPIFTIKHVTAYRFSLYKNEKYGIRFFCLLFVATVNYLQWRRFGENLWKKLLNRHFTQYIWIHISVLAKITDYEY